MQNKRLKRFFIVIVILLLIPFVAMQFTNEVDWKLNDFIVAGGLLFGAGIFCELVLRKVKKPKYRIAICAIILLALIIIWAELAVGIFGSPIAGT
ncbi:MAG: hypothetical protein HKO01_07360 [Flaviramulus sp.]|nr:hypothetical protein [Flaviramulus sp.]NNC50335.1 hypothetical protein [Flaviramulus sp.]